MDRRQRKTREAIFSAFSTLMKNQRYESITVQDIIDKADIGRSTFYSHFETKDTLLKAMCSDIFEHIIEGSVCDYPEKSVTLEARLTHILWHFENKKSDIRAILSSQSHDIFLGYLRDYLYTLFEMHLDDFHTKVPQSFLIHHLIGTFCEAVNWWIKESPAASPEQIATYYMSVIETH
ncbi:MAG: TetR/AcrR family transcriptional regulator [Clostridia bacterium]|nr:TetR/AcrR family transcriptional regulator [Clostridia bacterium]